MPKEKTARGLQAAKGEGAAKGAPAASRGQAVKAVVCPVMKKCGACEYIHLPYQEQLKIKQNKLEELLKGICKVHPMTGMKQPLHYRHKVHAVFGRDKKGNYISGNYQEGTHHIVPIENCLIQDEKANEIINTIRGMLKSFKITTYNEGSGYGLLRHVLIRKGYYTGEIMVVLVCTSPVFPSKNNFVKVLRKAHPEITTIVQNINARNTSMVLGDREQTLFGKGYIEDRMCGYTFRISPRSFYQVNPPQAEKLYQKALELARLTGKEKVIDAYCGTGTISVLAARTAAQVIGVELSKEAIRDAIINKRTNKAENVRFVQADASEFMINMAAEGESADVVIMDPPRNGSTEHFIHAVKQLGPKRVVYISCGPESLARDLKVFKRNGYVAQGAWGFDLFGGTGHTEVVVEICRK